MSIDITIETINVLSLSLGKLLGFLALIHFINYYMNRIRKK